MKVRDLIELLEGVDPDANVFVMSQQQWPFEYGVAGVTVREEFEGGEDDEDGGEDESAEDQAERRREAERRGEQPNDVFVVEGQQLRYGHKRAWDALR